MSTMATNRLLGDILWPSWPTFITVLTTRFVWYISAKIIYRLFFHPLRNFPEPKLAAVTFLYEAYFDILVPPGGQFIYHLDELHRKYGPVVRCSSDEILVSEFSFFNKLYAGPGHIRDRWGRSIRSNGAPGAVASALGHEHHRLRRSALGPFFSKRTIQELEGSIRDKTEKLCAKLIVSANNNKIVEMNTAFTVVTLDVISEYCYGKSLGSLDDEDYGKRWKEMVWDILGTVPMKKHFLSIATILQSLPRWVISRVNPVFSPLFQIRENIGVQAKKIWTEERASNGKVDNEEKPKAAFHSILRSNLPNSEKELSQMNEEAYVLITAGGETTARVLAVTLSYLLEDKTLLARLRKALDEFEGLPSIRILEKISLMKATIQEGLRIAVPVTNRQILIAPNEDLTCNNLVIPRGAPTSMTYKSVLLDPEIFPDPHTFHPDRWLQEGGRRLNQYLVTLQKGNRNCVGENLAWAEMYTILAAVVTRFDMELAGFERKRDLEVVRDLFVGMSRRVRG